MAQWTHDPLETPASMARHVSCVDCHNPHASTSRMALPPLVPGPLQGVSGVGSGGVPVGEATFEFQVCNKCHGYREPTAPGITRVEATRIVSTKLDPSNQSFHPITAPGRNATIKGLVPPYTASTVIGCIGCHNNNEWTTATGNAPKGPHASTFAPILERQYQTADGTFESQSSYDLCYKCHDRNALLQGASGGFPHGRHVVQQRAPCAACHDAHGSRQNAHLINFMTRDANGANVVGASKTGRIDYVPGAPGKGSCYLNCHGHEHNPSKY
jgi:hypothetical protein